MNRLISGTKVQQKLVTWKKKNSPGNSDENLGSVGVGYWNLFRKRHSEKFVSKRGQKFELDRTSWSTYTNFS